MSCNDKGKHGKNGNQMSGEEEKRVLKEEIDDEIIEADVAINRNQTKRFLDYEKADQIGLKEIYQHEEPYSIVFLDGNNFVKFQAANFKNAQIEANINLFIDAVNSPLEIRKALINGFHISFAEYEYNNRKWVHSVIDIDETDQKIMMQISSEEIIGSEKLIEKYIIVKKRRE